jgi:hypothetical protein
MAKYDVNHICGHTTTLELFGKEDARRYTVSQAAQQDCSACKTTAANAAALVAGLPVLLGSDKQVSWGQDIRAKILAKVDAMVFTESTAERSLKLVAQLRAKDNAKFWIDNRNLSALELLRLMINGG